jgi:hypothetical protein
MLLLPTLALTSPIISASDSWPDAPEHPLILTVTGELGCCPSGQARFDLQRLQTLPQVAVKTQPLDRSSEQLPRPQAQSVERQSPGRGEWRRATALNDYATRQPRGRGNIR